MQCKLSHQVQQIYRHKYANTCENFAACRCWFSCRCFRCKCWRSRCKNCCACRIMLLSVATSALNLLQHCEHQCINNNNIIALIRILSNLHTLVCKSQLTKDILLTSCTPFEGLDTATSEMVLFWTTKAIAAECLTGATNDRRNPTKANWKSIITDKTICLFNVCLKT